MTEEVKLALETIYGRLVRFTRECDLNFEPVLNIRISIEAIQDIIVLEGKTAEEIKAIILQKISENL